LTALFDALSERQIGLVSLKDGLDLSTPAGRLMANVLASSPPTKRKFGPNGCAPGRR
jgi:DNA invertase Pin-like site-specific DNA recombinase